MLIVGCDYHPRWQQVAWLDTETGEIGEQKLVNGDGEAARWYRQLPVPSLIGLEATGNSQWFIDLLNQLGHEVWVGDAAAIRASYVRRQKNDRRDAGHVLKLLREGRFPRLWVPSAEQRDLRQLLIHRHAHRCHSKPKGIAKVAAARRLVVRLYWMLRTNTPYPKIVRIESSPRVPLVGAS